MNEIYSKNVLFRLRSITIVAFFLGISFASWSQIINTFAGLSRAGSPGFSGDGGQATAAELDMPTGVAADVFGNVYIADDVNYRIRMVTSVGIITTIAGDGYSPSPLVGGFSGDGGPATAAELDHACSVAVDVSGNVYIADQANDRIRIVNTSGIISTFAGNGNATYSGDGGPATAAAIYNPYGVAVDASGNVYIAEETDSRIRKVNTSGIITTIAGNGGSGYVQDGVPATSTSLYYPYGVAVDALGNVYIPDDLDPRIRMVNTSGIITTIAGNGYAGYTGDGGPATAAEIDGPYAAAVDASGNVYITQRNGGTGIGNRVRVINTSGIISAYAGNGSQGFSGDGGPATAADLSAPWGLAVNTSGTLYIADEFNNRVREVTTFTVSANVTANVSCSGASTGSASAIPSGGTSPDTYSWSPGGGTNSTASGLSAGTYTITAMDNTGSTATASINITQPTALSTTASVLSNTCDGANNGDASASPSNGTSPYTYSWSNGTTTAATGNVLSAGTYTVTVQDSCGGSATASVTITAPTALSASASVTSDVSCNGDNNGSASASASNGKSPYTYSWGGGGGSNAVASGLSAGTYTVTVQDNCGGSSTASVTITQPNALSIGALAITNVSCNGESNGSATANAVTGGTSPYTYSWSPTGGNNLAASSLTAGTYTVAVTDNNGCTATASAAITQPNALNVSASASSVCARPTDTLTSIVSGGTMPYTYSWSPSGGSDSTSIVTPVNTTTYTITVTDSNGCSNSASVTASPVPVPGVSGTQTTCMGTPVSIVASGGATYTWSNGATTASITVNPPTTEVYTVTVANGSCTAQDSVKVIVNQAPSGTACCSTTIKMGENTALNISPAPATNSYDWTPSTGLSCTNCPNPIASPTVTTTYYVTITDSDECTERDSLTITVSENCGTIFIPNVFSPNGDGQNDVLYVMGNCITSMNFIIYDRWGNKVFESSDQSTGWDGTYKGKAASIGTYVYYFDGTTINNQTVTKKGTVTLVR